MSNKKHLHEHTGYVVDSVNNYDVIECELCGFKHIIPIPTADELEQVYREDYYSKEKPLYIERNQEDQDWWDIVYRERYDFFEEYLSGQNCRILDVGSGPGFFLLHGKQRGWKTVGIEPSKQAAAHARNMGIEIVEDFLNEDSAKQLGQFNVVHMSKVLEHIPDPKAMVELAASLLLPGGLLCVDVPNDYNPFQQALRTACNYEPWWVAPPHHINYFDFDSLSKLLKRHNFDIARKEASFPIDMFLLMGDNYIGNDELGRVCHGKRKTFELNLNKAGMNSLKQKLYKDLANANIGREIIMYAQKRA